MDNDLAALLVPSYDYGYIEFSAVNEGKRGDTSLLGIAVLSSTTPIVSKRV